MGNKSSSDNNNNKNNNDINDIDNDNDNDFTNISKAKQLIQRDKLLSKQRNPTRNKDDDGKIRLKGKGRGRGGKGSDEIEHSIITTTQNKYHKNEHEEDSQIEKTLLNRLLKLERSAAYYDQLCYKVERELRKHRITICKKKHLHKNK